MKTIVLILLITVSGLCHAQNDLTQEQTNSSKNFVLLKSGESIEFYRVSSVHKGNLKLQLKEAGENYFENFKIYKKIPVSSIDRISLSAEQNTFSNRNNETFSFNTGKIIKFKKKLVFAVELVSGPCSLYYHSFSNSMVDSNSYYFLVKREGEEEMTVLHGMTGTAPKFKRTGPKYFADCSEVVQKISESDAKARWEYLIPELTQFVMSYNETCGNSDSK